MAIYHLSVKIISRSAGRSAVAAAAYRSGDILTNEWDGITHDYSKKHWIEHTEILLPSNAPKEFKCITEIFEQALASRAEQSVFLGVKSANVF